MKQTIKRLLLMVCMAACLLSSTACSGSKESEEEAIDQQMVSYISQVTESLLEQMVSVPESELDNVEKGLLDEDQNALANGIVSWKGVMKDTGSFVSVNSSNVELIDGEYVCTVQSTFENRNVEFKVFYVMKKQNLEPTAVSFTPEYTVGENMSKAAMNTLMGMGTVFAVLIFISLLIGCFKYISVWENKMKAKAAPAANVAPAAVAETPVEEEELVDDLELVAVITAAIAAASNSSTDGLVVRSIKRAPVSKWKRA